MAGDTEGLNVLAGDTKVLKGGGRRHGMVLEGWPGTRMGSKGLVEDTGGFNVVGRGLGCTRLCDDACLFKFR